MILGFARAFNSTGSTRLLAIHAHPLADDALPEPDEGQRLADGGSTRSARARAVRE